MMNEHQDPSEIDDQEPAMPAGAKESASMVQATPSSAPVDIGPPPTFGKQMAQLVIIPAVIAMIAIALFWLFGSIAATPDSLKDQLSRLKQSSGYGGNLIAGAQDPRYKDRCQAAFQIATLIEKIEDEKEREDLSKELIAIINERVHPDDEDLQYFMVMAIGRLGQVDGLRTILDRAESKLLRVRVGVVGGVLAFAEGDALTARLAITPLTKMLADPYEQVRTLAAVALWKVASKQDTQLIAPLREAMASVGVDPNNRLYQSAITHAAIALAALDDERGSEYVANTLLNRKELANQRADMTGQTDALMNANEQDHFIASVLHYVSKMNSELVWTRVKELAENDPSVSIRKAALQLLAQRKGQD